MGGAISFTFVIVTAAVTTIRNIEEICVPTITITTLQGLFCDPRWPMSTGGASHVTLHVIRGYDMDKGVVGLSCVEIKVTGTVDCGRGTRCFAFGESHVVVGRVTCVRKCPN